MHLWARVLSLRSSIIMKSNPNQTEIWTIMRLIQWGADFFKKKGIDSPRLTMELMLSHVLKLSRFELYMKFDRPLTDVELDQLRAMVRRRAAREPLQYILGEAHFYGRTFEVNGAVLIPRPETELLVQEALRRVQTLRTLDVGTGSGCIGITVALERPETEVVAIDSSREALELARANAVRLGARNVSFPAIDFFDEEGMRSLGSFDLIISNPPYIPAADITSLEPEVRDHEPRLALTDEGDGYAFYRRFIDLAPRMIRDDGSLFLELGYGQSATVAAMFRKAGFAVDLLTDLDKVERILWARAGGR
jgi:release factor glutamine methyltransferase